MQSRSAQQNVFAARLIKTEDPKRVQKENIKAASVVSHLIQGGFGPNGGLKMVLTRINKILVTNDGDAILREMDVTHPVAKMLMELSAAQDRSVGDGTKGTIILAASVLRQIGSLIAKDFHPIIVSQELANVKGIVDDFVKNTLLIPVVEREKQENVIRCALHSKLSTMLGISYEDVALRTVDIVRDAGGRIDLKGMTRIERLVTPEETKVSLIDGIILNKNMVDPTSPEKIENPRILLIDFPIEYVRPNDNAKIEVMQRGVITQALQIEEQQIEGVCLLIAEVADVVVAEKGVSEFAASILNRRGVSAIRRTKHMDLVRIANVSGAKIVSRPEDISPAAVGTDCGIFERTKVLDEYYCGFRRSKNQHACTIMLEGPTRDIIGEMEQNLREALATAKNIALCPAVLPGGGAAEMAVASMLEKYAYSSPVQRRVGLAVAKAFEAIPFLIADNSESLNPVDTVAKLRTLHASGSFTSGIDSENDRIADVSDSIVDPYVVKNMQYQSVFGFASMLVRIDGIVSSVSQK